jgi:hypothetical protein
LMRFPAQNQGYNLLLLLLLIWICKERPLQDLDAIGSHNGHILRLLASISIVSFRHGDIKKQERCKKHQNVASGMKMASGLKYEWYCIITRSSFTFSRKVDKGPGFFGNLES